MIRFQKTAVPFKPSCTLVEPISVARVRHLSRKSPHKVGCGSIESGRKDASQSPPAIEILIHLLVLAKLAPRRCDSSNKTLLLLSRKHSQSTRYSNTKTNILLMVLQCNHRFLASNWQTQQAELSKATHHHHHLSPPTEDCNLQISNQISYLKFKFEIQI